MGLYNHDQYVSVTMHFHCNLKCEHCMIEGTMDWLQPQSDDDLRRIMTVNAQYGRWKGLILTGSEITLRPDLPDLARAARRSGFDHVRIQTHGMRLANEAYCRELVEAGVDEFFVSVAGSDPETHDAITTVRGSFEKTLRGLENLDRFEVDAITNTVVTRRSYTLLPGAVEALAHLERLRQMEFWHYWPMAERDDKGLLVSHLETLPYLRRAIARGRELGRSIEVKNFPECLLGELGDALDNEQPKLYIDPSFWTQFARNGFDQCVHRERCASQRCLGLNSAYVAEYGWHADELIPLTADPAA